MNRKTKEREILVPLMSQLKYPVLSPPQRTGLLGQVISGAISITMSLGSDRKEQEELLFSFSLLSM
eukprot:2403829-Rhodomonas_salina.1